ncbi:M48 family metallopeptidase [Pseudomonas sp. 3A(2025)]
MKNLKLVAVLVLLPLCLALFGAWELQRSVANTREHAELRTWLTDLGPTIKTLRARPASEMVDVGGTKMPAAQVLARIDSLASGMDTLQAIDRSRQVLAIAVIALSLLATVIGLAALIGLSSAAARALRSREHLLRIFTRASKVLPYGLVGHILVMGAAVVAMLGFEGLGVWHAGKLSSGEVKVMAVAAIIMLLCLYSLWHVVRQLRVMLHMFEPVALSVHGRPVSHEQAPGLWAFVNALADRLGALAPEHIVVGLHEGFYVTSSDIELLPCQSTLSGRTLHVPVIYLGVLDTAELSAVIGHELGHFVGDDTEYSLRFLPVYDGIGRSLGVIGGLMIEGGLLRRTLLRPAFMLGVYFLECFDHSVSHWSRLRELAADAAGAKLGGHLAAASALVRISAIEPLLLDALQARIDPHDDPQPADLPASLLEELAQKTLALPAEHLAVQLPHPSDSHPSNGERFAALQVDADDAVAHGLRPVVATQACANWQGYLADAPALCAVIGQDFLEHYAAQDAELVQQLHEVAGQVSGEVRFHEGAHVQGWITSILFGLVGLAGVAAIAIPLLFTQDAWDVKEPIIIIGVVIAASIASLLPASVIMIRRAGETALLLTPDHLVFARIKEPVPIVNIAEFSLNIAQGMYLVFVLEDDAPLPQASPRSHFKSGVSVDKKNRLIRLRLTRFCHNGRSLNPDELVTLVGDYLHAGHARHALQQRAGQV